MFRKPTHDGLSVSPEWQAMRDALAERQRLTPQPAYFEGLVEEFHRRQRQQLLERVSLRRTIANRWQAFTETLAEKFALGPVLRPQLVGLAACAVIALVSLVSFESRDNQGAALASNSSYAFKQLPGGVGDLDQQWDAAVVGETSRTSAPAQYLLVSSNTSYDNTLAF